MGKLAPRAARPGSIPRLAAKMNPIDKEKEKFARMKEAKAKYSQMSRNFATGRTVTNASSAPKPSAVTTATKGPTANIPIARKTSATATSFRGSATNVSRDEFVACADSLDAIRNNRTTQVVGRASGFGFGRPSLMPRPSLLPFGINPFSDKCTADDKKIFNDYMKERLGPTSPMITNSIGRPNLGVSRVRFLSEDVIEESRESGVLVEEKKPTTPIKEAKNEVRSILKSRLDTSKPNHSELIVEEKENEPVAESACSSFKKIEETPMLRRSKRPSLLFAESTDGPSGSKSPMVVTSKVRPSPIMSRVSEIDEEPAPSTPSSILKANTAASTLKGWIDFYQSWIAATDEAKAMFPEAMFTELCSSFEAEKRRRNDKSDNVLRRSKRITTEKKMTIQ